MESFSFMPRLMWLLYVVYWLWALRMWGRHLVGIVHSFSHSAVCLLVCVYAFFRNQFQVMLFGPKKSNIQRKSNRRRTKRKECRGCSWKQLIPFVVLLQAFHASKCTMRNAINRRPGILLLLLLCSWCCSMHIVYILRFLFFIFFILLFYFCLLSIFAILLCGMFFACVCVCYACVTACTLLEHNLLLLLWYEWNNVVKRSLWHGKKKKINMIDTEEWSMSRAAVIKPIHNRVINTPLIRQLFFFLLCHHKTLTIQS